MSVDVFSLSCSALQTAKLVAFKGTEQISRPYELEVFFTVPSGTDVRAAVGEKVTLSADRGEEAEAMYWHGIFARVRMLRTVAERTLYRGTMVPKLWRLRHSFRSSVFTKKKLEDFLGDTLKDGGLADGDFRFLIDESRYPEEEFVAQYRETHLDFFHRWLEREGLYYYFEHEADEGGQEILVIVDDKGQHAPLGDDGHVRYYPAGGDVSSGECLSELECDYQALPAGVLVTDYNYANPALPVQGEHAVSPSGKGRIRDYGYRVFDEGEATRLAEVKAQALGCRELTLRAVGNAFGLRAGYTVDIDDLGADELPAGWLPYEVRHAGAVSGATVDVSAYTGLRGDETYRVELYAIPKDVQYRAPQAAPWPRIYGFENAVVDGPAESEYAQIDDMGRYLVKFYFDASDLSDGVASTYVRMAQPHGGQSEGHHFPLRKGTEVMVAFSGGDPDRPLISGVVPNATHPSTVTSHNHTENIIRTGGGNYVKFEDQKGKEYVHLFTPKRTEIFLGGPTPEYFGDETDYLQFSEPSAESFTSPASACVPTAFYVNTDQSAGFKIARDWWQEVGANMNVSVTGNVKQYYGGLRTLNIATGSNEYFGDHRKTETHGPRNDKIVGDVTHTISGSLEQTVGNGGSQTVTGAWTHDVSALNHDKYGSWKTNTSTWNGTFTGAVTLDAGGQTVKLTAAKVEIISPDVTIDGASVKTKASGVNWNFTPSWSDVFGIKYGFGGASVSITGGKLDVVPGVTIGLWGAKIDLGGFKQDNKACNLKTWAFTNKVAGSETQSGGAKITTWGFRKL